MESSSLEFVPHSVLAFLARNLPLGSGGIEAPFELIQSFRQRGPSRNPGSWFRKQPGYRAAGATGQANNK
jgi:hypothetical protein